MLQTTIAHDRDHTFNKGNWSGEEITIHPTLNTSSGDDVIRFEMYGYNFWLTCEHDDPNDLEVGNFPFMTWTCYGEEWDYPLVVATAVFTGKYQDRAWVAFQKDLGEAGIVRDSFDPLKAIVQVLCNIL